MPRPRARPLFELAGQWIALEHGSRSLYRFWHDAGAARTRRASLGTTDLEAAKRKLAEIVINGSPKTGSTPLSTVLLDYFVKRTDRLPSGKVARQAGRIMLRAWGNSILTSQVDEAKQREFAEWSIGQGHSLAYISRNLSVLAAALAHARIDAAVIYNENTMAAKWGLASTPKREVFIPSDQELARFLSAETLPGDMFRWCVISLLTGCRPEAAIDLSPEQRLKDAGLVNLNPAGRVQNKKYRPTVRTPRTLAQWLDRWEREAARVREIGAGPQMVERYCGYASVESVKSAIERIRVLEDVSLPRLSSYSFRHKVTTVLRLSRIPEDEIAMQIGHRRRDVRTTAGYGEWSPDYLARSAAALDAWFVRLQRLCDRQLLATGRSSRSFSQGFPKSVRRRITRAA